jgi:FSR family fosmidomycin resistance protein-like MFS transporter
MTQGMNKKVLALLGLGHLMVDLNTGALPALLPFLKSAFGLSYTMTSTLVLVANMSSLIQPIFGHLLTLGARAWLLPVGVMGATCGMATLGLAPNFAGLLFLIFLSGLGIASYHPEAYKTAYLATGEKKATGISLFSVGGNIGYGLGPLVVAFCLTMFGQRGLLLLWAPGLLVGALFLWALPWLSRTTNAITATQIRLVAPLLPMRSRLYWDCHSGSLRTPGMVTYVPLIFRTWRKRNLVSSLLSLFLISGAAGTLVAGPLSDRIGHKRFLTLSMGVVSVDYCVLAFERAVEHRYSRRHRHVFVPDVFGHSRHCSELDARAVGSYGGFDDWSWHWRWRPRRDRARQGC